MLNPAAIQDTGIDLTNASLYPPDAGAQQFILPVYFHGQNSRLFQIASHISLTTRMALLLHEVTDKIGCSFTASIGNVILYEDLQPMRDTRALSLFLRARTYALTAPSTLAA